MRYLLIIFLSLILSKVLLAEDMTVEMLNKLEKRNMVFSQEIVRINPGDTVFGKLLIKDIMLNLYLKMVYLKE